MPRPKKTGRSRDYDPTPTEKWWLVGKPFPPIVPGIVQRELGGGSPDEYTLQGLNALEALTIRDNLDRLRRLYEAAPKSIRRRVPETRRKILEQGPTPELLEADRQRTEKLQRETTWKNDYLNRWLAMSGEEQHAVITRLVRRKATMEEE